MPQAIDLGLSRHMGLAGATRPVINHVGLRLNFVKPSYSVTLTNVIMPSLSLNFVAGVYKELGS